MLTDMENFRLKRAIDEAIKDLEIALTRKADPKELLETIRQVSDDLKRAK